MTASKATVCQISKALARLQQGSQPLRPVFLQPHKSKSVTDPQGPAQGQGRVLRGGSWFNAAGYCRSSYRIRHSPDGRDDFIGLRVAADVPPKTP